MRKLFVFLVVFFISITYVSHILAGVDTLDSHQKESSIMFKEISEKLNDCELVIYHLEKELTDNKQNEKVNLIIAVLSVFVALGLLVITYLNNKNNRNILQSQIEDQRKFHRAQFRPIVDAYRSGWTEETSLVMINYGLGPAVLKEVIFEKEGYRPTTTISDIIDLKDIDADVWWDTKWSFSKKDYFLFPKQRVELYKVSKQKLINEYSKTVDEAEQIINKVREKRDGITLTVRYCDVVSFDNDKEAKEHIARIKLFD